MHWCSAAAEWEVDRGFRGGWRRPAAAGRVTAEAGAHTASLRNSCTYRVPLMSKVARIRSPVWVTTRLR